MRTKFLPLLVSSLLLASCAEDGAFHDLPTPIGVQMNQKDEGVSRTVSLRWDSLGAWNSEIWRSVDAGATYELKLDDLPTFQYLDSGGAELDTAVYIIRFVLGSEHHSAFTNPTCLRCPVNRLPDPNASVTTPDGTVLVCH